MAKFVYLSIFIFLNFVLAIFGYHDVSDGRHYRIEVEIGDEAPKTLPRVEAVPNVQISDKDAVFPKSEDTEKQNVDDKPTTENSEIPHDLEFTTITTTEEPLSTYDPSRPEKTDGETPHSQRTYADGEPIYPRKDCYTNQYGFMCCNEELEQSMEDAYNDLLLSYPSWTSENIQKIANNIQSWIQTHFQHQFEVIVGISDFGSKSHFYKNLICKIERDSKVILAYATSRRSRLLTYGDLDQSIFEHTEVSQKVVQKLRKSSQQTITIEEDTTTLETPEISTTSKNESSETVSEEKSVTVDVDTTPETSNEESNTHSFHSKKSKSLEDAKNSKASEEKSTKKPIEKSSSRSLKVRTRVRASLESISTERSKELAKKSLEDHDPSLDFLYGARILSKSIEN